MTRLNKRTDKLITYVVVAACLVWVTGCTEESANREGAQIPVGVVVDDGVHAVSDAACSPDIQVAEDCATDSQEPDRPASRD